MAGSVRSLSWPWRKAGKPPEGWHHPYTFGWVKSVKKGIESWECPDGSIVVAVGKGTEVFCRRRPDGKVTHGTA